jgi:uncharacterized membrane protein
MIHVPVIGTTDRPAPERWNAPERAAIGPIPGAIVVAAGALFHGGWAAIALVTYRIEVASRRERKSLIAMG